MADSLLYDLNHLPRAAPPPECVHLARAQLQALAASSGVAPPQTPPRPQSGPEPMRS